MAEGRGYQTRSKSKKQAKMAARRDREFKETDVGINIIVGNCLNVHPKRLIWWSLKQFSEIVILLCYGLEERDREISQEEESRKKTEAATELRRKEAYDLY